MLTSVAHGVTKKRCHVMRISVPPDARCPSTAIQREPWNPCFISSREVRLPSVRFALPMLASPNFHRDIVGVKRLTASS